MLDLLIIKVDTKSHMWYCMLPFISPDSSFEKKLEYHNSLSLKILRQGRILTRTCYVIIKSLSINLSWFIYSTEDTKKCLTGNSYIIIAILLALWSRPIGWTIILEYFVFTFHQGPLFKRILDFALSLVKHWNPGNQMLYLWFWYFFVLLFPSLYSFWSLFCQDVHCENRRYHLALFVQRNGDHKVKYCFTILTHSLISYCHAGLCPHGNPPW